MSNFLLDVRHNAIRKTKVQIKIKISGMLTLKLEKKKRRRKKSKKDYYFSFIWKKWVVHPARQNLNKNSTSFLSKWKCNRREEKKMVCYESEDNGKLIWISSQRGRVFRISFQTFASVTDVKNETFLFHGWAWKVLAQLKFFQLCTFRKYWGY